MQTVLMENLRPHMSKRSSRLGPSKSMTCTLSVSARRHVPHARGTHKDVVQTLLAKVVDLRDTRYDAHSCEIKCAKTRNTAEDARQLARMR
jgi:hypothetical protein